VIGIFKQKNPGNNLLLFFFTLILKFPIFLNPAPPARQPQDDYLYRWLLDFLEPLGLPAIFYILVAFFLLFIQATLFNRICNALKLFAKPNYLPGMTYILLSSLFEEWNQFSAPLLINTLLIWSFYRMTALYNTSKANYGVFNIGLMLGVITLFYQPAIVFVLLLIPFTLFIMRPFRLREWLIGLLGITTPYYFLGVLLFITDRFRWQDVIPVVSFDMPVMPSSIYITIGICLLVIPFIIGGYFVQDNLNKMLIQVRKSWSLLLIFLMISLIMIIVNEGNRYVSWLCSIIPLSAFHAAAYYYIDNKLFSRSMFWLIFVYAMYLNYGPILT
jgi:hypothetical protein